MDQNVKPVGLTYRADLDGFRAIAVIAVIIYHLEPSWLKGGFLGVDMFFVLSGYLITHILYARILVQQFSVRWFWGRRIRRLYPALMSVVVFSWVVGALVTTEPERGRQFMDGVAAIFSYQNLWLWRTTGGYWDVASHSLAFLHTWSLSLEEQFYLLFPGYLLLLVRTPRRLHMWITAGLGIVSLWISVRFTATHPSPAFYLLPSRMWELVMGSLWALYIVGRGGREVSMRRWLRELMQWIGIGLIAYSLIAIESDQKFPGYQPLYCCVGVLLFIISGEGRASLAGLLRTAPVVYIGRLSYSLYLWHWPVMVFIGYFFIEPGVWKPLLFSLLLAMFSYHLIETPMRRRLGFKVWPWAVLVLAVLAAGALQTRLKQSPLLEGLGDIQAEASMTRGWEYEGTQQILRGDGGIWLGEGGEAQGTLCLVGSSHARVLGAGIKALIEREGGRALVLASSGVGVVSSLDAGHFKHWEALNAERERLIKASDCDVLLIAGRWERELATEQARRKFAAYLKEMGAAVGEILVLGQVPRIWLPDGHKGSLRQYLIAQRLRRGEVTYATAAEVVEANKMVEAIVLGLGSERIRYIDTHRYFEEKGSFAPVGDGAFLYSDDNHVNDRGAEHLIQRVMEDVR